MPYEQQRTQRDQDAEDEYQGNGPQINKHRHGAAATVIRPVVVQSNQSEESEADQQIFFLFIVLMTSSPVRNMDKTAGQSAFFCDSADMWLLVRCGSKGSSTMRGPLVFYTKDRTN